MELFQVLHHLHLSKLILLGGKVAALISEVESAEKQPLYPRLGLNVKLIRLGMELQI